MELSRACTYRKSNFLSHLMLEHIINFNLSNKYPISTLTKLFCLTKYLLFLLFAFAELDTILGKFLVHLMFGSKHILMQGGSTSLILYLVFRSSSGQSTI
ncbi:CLUMA_CG012718, isoform A [Clunio marinus]|uniref:CLUMA_CG012718, isoform A n=1 Tax=Clunio marinus TaxID=568069 RepID=A0A1J1IGZ1_9DIPT|nr:CLUMA_CG012718, isoform A [Clunio marinus]